MCLFAFVFVCLFARLLVTSFVDLVVCSFVCLLAWLRVARWFVRALFCCVACLFA